MGRTEPTVVKPPAAFRRDARAKRARATINKVIPALLTAHPRARRGIERSELIVDPPQLAEAEAGHHQREGKNGEDPTGIDGVEEGGKGSKARRGGGRRKENSLRDDDSKNTSGSRARKGGSDNVRNPRITLCVADTLAAAHSLLDSGSAQQGGGQHQKQRSRDEERATPNTRPTKVGILNMASPLSPGGGFLNGATSQEETLCMHTTLLPALRDEFYRLPELGVVYTPDVLVFRSSSSSDKGVELGAVGGAEGEEQHEEKDILTKNDRWYVDVASAAMLRLPETEDGTYASATDRELVVRKMRAVLRVFASRGRTRVVLGAWGCGAYGNPVAEIAKAWRKVLGVDSVVSDGVEEKRARDKIRNGQNAPDAQTSNRSNAKGKRKNPEDKKSRKKNKPEPWGVYIEEIVFAIKDGGMAAAFARAFGEDILLLPASLSGVGGGGGGGGGGENGSLSSTAGGGDEDEYLDNPVEVACVNELREKIAQLEAQIEQTRNPQMQAGLEAVLASLKKRFPAENEGVEEEEEEDGGDGDDGGSEAPEEVSSSELDETGDRDVAG